MPNMEIPVMPSTPEAMIACAIYCCDRKVYSMASHPPFNPCCSLGKKKDTCVRRNVKRAKAENGLTDEDIKVEPKQTVMVGNEGFNCKPDFMIGNRIIDAKFPCDTDKLAHE